MTGPQGESPSSANPEPSGLSYSFLTDAKGSFYKKQKREPRKMRKGEERWKDERNKVLETLAGLLKGGPRSL